MKALLDNLNFLKDVAGFYEIRVDEDFKANLYSLKLSVEKKNFPTFEDMELIYPLSKRDYYELLFKTRSFPVN